MKNTERYFHSRLTLTGSSTTRNVVDFPLNKLISAIYLRFSAVLTVGGTAINYVANTNPALAIIKNITFKTASNGIAVNAPAAALYQLAAIKQGIYPRIDNASYDPAAEAAYTLTCCIPLLFTDPLMARPEDTILDMSRESGAELFITMGDGSEGHETGVGSGGTFTLSAMTCDIEIESLAGAPRDSVRPLFFQQVTMEGGAKNVASDTTAQLTRSSDRLLKRVLVGAHGGAVISEPFNGLVSDAIIDTMSFSDGRIYYDKSHYQSSVHDFNNGDYQITMPAGFYVLDYVRDGSNFSAIPTGDKPELKLDYTVGGSAPAYTNIVSVCSETLNKLK